MWITRDESAKEIYIKFQNMEMRYFTYELISAANDWIGQSKEDSEKADKLFWKVAENYNEALDELKPRPSRKVWEFFRYGFAETGLHDANLLALRAGNAISYESNGKQPLKLNQKKASAQIAFLNYEQNLHHLFDVRGVCRFSCNLFVEDQKDFSDLFTYEIVALNDDYLQPGFLFASGATVIIQFRKLVFHKRKIKREYPINDIYN